MNRGRIFIVIPNKIYNFIRNQVKNQRLKFILGLQLFAFIFVSIKIIYDFFILNICFLRSKSREI